MGIYIGKNILFLLIEELAKRLSEEVVNFPIAEEKVIGEKNF